MSTELIFEEPRGGGRPSVYLNWLIAIRSHPNQWVRFPDLVGGGAQTAVWRLIRTHNLGDYEVTTRSIPHDDRRNLYARFAPPVANLMGGITLGPATNESVARP